MSFIKLTEPQSKLFTTTDKLIKKSVTFKWPFKKNGKQKRPTLTTAYIFAVRLLLWLKWNVVYTLTK